VGLSLPVEVILPFRVAVVDSTEVAEDIVIVGTETTIRYPLSDVEF
jgi:hypothetical protein